MIAVVIVSVIVGAGYWLADRPVPRWAAAVWTWAERGGR